MNKKTVKTSFIASLPVCAGYVVLGTGFGLLMYDKGYGVLWAFVMSLTIYAGSMQYVGAGLMAGGASLISTALTTVMVNIRHLFYGISMLDKYKQKRPGKIYTIFALTDETYSLVCDTKDLPPEVDENLYFLLVSAFNQSYWVIGTLIGSLVGTLFSFNTTGVDFSMTALFVVVFVNQWEQTKQHIPALLGLAVSVICLILFGADHFLIPTMICIPVLLFLLRPVLEKGESHE